MSDFGKFEKELAEKFNEHHIEKDYGKLWDRLEPSLPKKKRRYFFIWFFGLAFLLTGAIALLQDNSMFSINEKHETSDQASLIDALEGDRKTKTASINKDDLSSKLGQVNTTDTNDLENKENKENKENEKKSDQSIGEEVSTEGFIPINNSVKIQSAAIKISALKSKDQGDISFEQIEENDDIIASDIKDDMNTELKVSEKFQNMSIESISKLIPKIAINSKGYRIVRPLTYNQSSSSENHESKFIYGIDLVGGSFIDRGTMSKDLEYLKEFFSPTAILDAGLFVSYQLNSSFSFRLSARYLSYTEKYAYKDERTSIETIQNDEAYIVNGDFRSAMQKVEVNTVYDIFNYNKLKAFALSPSLSYYPFKQKKFGINLHCSLVLSQDYTGSLLDQNFNLIKSGPLLKSRMMSTFNPGIGVSYPVINGKIKSNLLMRYQYSQLSSNENRHGYTMGLSFSW